MHLKIFARKSSFRVTPNKKGFKIHDSWDVKNITHKKNRERLFTFLGNKCDLFLIFNA